VKGGVAVILVFVGKSSGKTTNAVNCAAALAQRPVSRRSSRTRVVRLLDADPQGSASEWAAQRDVEPLFEVRPYVSPTIHKELPELLAGVDDLVIDAPAGTGRPLPIPDGRIQITRSAILAALSDDHGVVVVPVTPSAFDLWAGDDLMAVIEEAWTFDGAAPRARSRAVLLLNRAGLTRRGGEGRPDRVPRIVRAARTRLDAAPLPMLNTVIHDRQDYVLAPIYGLSVPEYAPRGAAADEVNALTTELLTLAGEKK
jgi:chromosome partitioning protein